MGIQTIITMWGVKCVCACCSCFGSKQSKLFSRVPQIPKIRQKLTLETGAFQGLSLETGASLETGHATQKQLGEQGLEGLERRTGQVNPRHEQSSQANWKGN